MGIASRIMDTATAPRGQLMAFRALIERLGETFRTPLRPDKIGGSLRARPTEMEADICRHRSDFHAIIRFGLNLQHLVRPQDRIRKVNSQNSDNT